MSRIIPFVLGTLIATGGTLAYLSDKEARIEEFAAAVNIAPMPGVNTVSLEGALAGEVCIYPLSISELGLIEVPGEEQPVALFNFSNGDQVLLLSEGNNGDCPRILVDENGLPVDARNIVADSRKGPELADTITLR